MNTVDKRKVKLVIIAGVVLACVLYLPQIWSGLGKVLAVFKPIFIGLFIAMVLNIPTKFLAKKVFTFKGKKPKLSKMLAMICSYVAFFGVVFLILYSVIPPLVDSVSTLKDNLPAYLDNADNWLMKTLTGIGVNQETIDGWKESIAQQGDSVMEELIGKLPQLIAMAFKTLSGLMSIFFAFIFSIYMISEQSELRAQIGDFTKSILPPKMSKVLCDAVQLFSTVFTKFIGGQAAVSFILGVINVIFMLICGMPYAVLVSVIVAVTNMIPVLGSYIGSVFGLSILLLVDVRLALLFLIFTLILQQIEQNFIYPKVVGNTLALSSFWVLTAVLIGGGLFGFWGVMLGVPVVAVAYKMFDKRAKETGDGEFLSAEV